MDTWIYSSEGMMASIVGVVSREKVIESQLLSIYGLCCQEAVLSEKQETYLYNIFRQDLTTGNLSDALRGRLFSFNFNLAQVLQNLGAKYSAFNQRDAVAKYMSNIGNARSAPYTYASIEFFHSCGRRISVKSQKV